MVIGIISHNIYTFASKLFFYNFYISMKVYTAFSPLNIQYSKNQDKNVSTRFNNTSLSYDTVSFGAMKKSDFKGIDRVCVEKFKAPIEKFNKNEDLQNWAGKLLNNIIKKDYKGRQQATVTQRKNLINEWSNYVTKENDSYNNSAGLLIMSSITKDLKPENDALPPVLNKSVLADIMSEINKGQDVNILKKYKNQIKGNYFNKNQNISDQTGWVIIPSKAHDSKNYSENVEKLKALSHHNWCTSSFKAEFYLADGDFHIYLEQGKPKLGVSFNKNKIHEIQGECNNSKIPNKYLDIAQEHVKEYKLSSGAKAEINKANKAKQQLAKLSKFLNEKDDYEIFGYLGYLPNSKGSILDSKEKNFFDKICNFFGLKKEESIQFPKRKSNNITLAFYKQPKKDLIFEDLGIDENKLFKNVTKIQGEANFSRSNLQTLYNLETISGNVDFDNSKIKNLGKLKRIDGKANFSHSNIKDLGNLEYIGGDAWFFNSETVSLAKVKKIGGTIGFSDSKIEDLGNLKVIGKNAVFTNSQIKSLKNLQEIKGSANFSKSKVEDLGMLENIGEDAVFENSNIKELKNLKNIGGTAYINHSGIKPSDFNNVCLKNLNQ